MSKGIEQYRELLDRVDDICLIIWEVQRKYGGVPLLIPDFMRQIKPGHYVDASVVFCVLQDIIADGLVYRDPHGYMLTELGEQRAALQGGFYPEPQTDGPRLRNSLLASQESDDQITL